MARFSPATIEDWRQRIQALLESHGLTMDAVTDGIGAWSVAHKSGITHEAYQDRNVVDAHIQTALEKIFPKVVFRDRKIY